MTLRRYSWVLMALFGLAACESGTEAGRVELSMMADSSGLVPVTTDLGYEVSVSEITLYAEDFLFVTSGESTLAAVRPLPSPTFWDWLVPSAYAHPGHFSGGEVAGELLGAHHIHWRSGESGEFIGTATMVHGDFESGNFELSQGSDGITAVLTGTIARGEEEWVLTATLVAPAARELTGAPCTGTVGSTTESIGFRVLTADTFEGDTLFDGLDFATLDPDEDGIVEIGPGAESPELEEAYLELRRTFQTHDHFDFVIR